MLESPTTALKMTSGLAALILSTTSCTSELPKKMYSSPTFSAPMALSWSETMALTLCGQT